ncbi:type II toxin-antitoxin system Phd/YefM family antitoxin [Streptomyces sp. NPDC059989]|uniref:type II toxin-antitoxin system Phd/YefM family antitoxin n=1 Tax=Streptomyces sp. NPDC059989 TaxID=3347026 RepID=UPI0036B98866
MEAAAQYDVHEASTHIAAILQLVATGQEVIITRAGEPVAKVVPFTRNVPRTARGSLSEPVVFFEDRAGDASHDARA